MAESLAASRLMSKYETRHDKTRRNTTRQDTFTPPYNFDVTRLDKARLDLA
jgi:hypothetical protein